MESSAGCEPEILWIDVDLALRDFNFCGHPDSQCILLRQLGKWAFEARRGDVVARRQYAITMCWTLRQTTFEAYIRTYPLYSISYTLWFRSKVEMFLRILMDSDPGTPFMDRPKRGLLRAPDYSDALLEPDHPLFQLKPEDDERFDWHGLVRAISEHPEDRDAALRAWLKQQLPASTPEPRQPSPRKALRSKLIRQALEEGKSRFEVCEMLDGHGIAVSQKMMKAGIATFRMAWNDKKFRANCQTMISNALKELSSTS